MVEGWYLAICALDKGKETDEATDRFGVCAGEIGWWCGLFHSKSSSRTLLYSTAPVHRGPYCLCIDSVWLRDVIAGLKNELLMLIPNLALTSLFQCVENLWTSLAHTSIPSAEAHHHHWLVSDWKRLWKFPRIENLWIKNYPAFPSAFLHSFLTFLLVLENVPLFHKSILWELLGNLALGKSLIQWKKEVSIFWQTTLISLCQGAEYKKGVKEKKGNRAKRKFKKEKEAKSEL